MHFCKSSIAHQVLSSVWFEWVGSSKHMDPYRCLQGKGPRGRRGPGWWHMEELWGNAGEPSASAGNKSTQITRDCGSLHNRQTNRKHCSYGGNVLRKRGEAEDVNISCLKKIFISELRLKEQQTSVTGCHWFNLGTLLSYFNIYWVIYNLVKFDSTLYSIVFYLNVLRLCNPYLADLTYILLSFYAFSKLFY